MKRDREVLKIDLYGSSGIDRTKNKVSENSLHFIPLLVGEKQGINSNNFVKVGASTLRKNIYN